LPRRHIGPVQALQAANEQRRLRGVGHLSYAGISEQPVLHARRKPMPTIARGAELQTVITTFEMTPGTCEDLLDELRDAYENFIRHQPGFIGAGLHVNDAQTRIANYSQWSRREDFLAMLRSEEMRERNRRLTALCRSFEPVMYEVAESFN
jgi:quinol monooxygenase YgiN